MTEEIGLPTMARLPEQPVADLVNNPFASILPLMMSLPTGAEPKDKTDPKPSRYLVAKGLHILAMETVEQVWSMWTWRNSFLHLILIGRTRQISLFLPGEPGGSPQPISGNLAAEGTASSSGHYDLGQMFHPVYSSYGKEVSRGDPVHGGTSPYCAAAPPSHKLAWLKYDIQFRMEMAASGQSVVDMW